MFKDIEKTAEKARGMVDTRLGLKYSDVIAIKQKNQSNWLSLISDSFCIGYMQGMKAAKKLQNKSGA